MNNSVLEGATKGELLALKLKATKNLTRRYKALNARYLRGCYRKESVELQLAVDWYNEVDRFVKRLE